MGTPQPTPSAQRRRPVVLRTCSWFSSERNIPDIAMSMRQFGRFPGLPRPTPQTIQMLLEQRKTILPNVSKITLEWSKIGPGNGGIR
jgi:hypothetical protein